MTDKAELDLLVAILVLRIGATGVWLVRSCERALAVIAAVVLAIIFASTLPELDVA